MAYQAAEEGDSLCAGQFNPINPNIFAIAGDSTGLIQVWDIRMNYEAIHNFQYHSQQVTVLEWCPSNEYLLASGSDDKLIYIWDLS